MSKSKYRKLYKFSDRVFSTLETISTLSKREDKLTREWTAFVVKGFLEVIEIANRKFKDEEN